MKFLLLNGFLTDLPDKRYVLIVNQSLESHYEYVVLAPTYRQTASYLFRWFRNMSSSCGREDAPEKISSMTAAFDACQDQLPVSLKQYIFVEGILLTSYRLKLDDSDIICEMLKLMHRCWLSFGPLHFKAVLGGRRRGHGKISAKFLSFFLEHCRRKELLCHEKRMIDCSIYSLTEKAPVFLAAGMWRWRQTLAYLQYGAKIENIYQDTTLSRFRQHFALIETLRKLISDVWFYLVSPVHSLSSTDSEAAANYCENLDENIKNLCRTINVILRAIRQLPSGCLEFVIKDFDDPNTIQLILSRDVMSHCVVTTMIPKLFERYENPVNLKHGCRLVIREQLNENWQLPCGIRNLVIPLRLKRYLNLLED